MKCFYCDSDLPINLVLFIQDKAVGRVHCVMCQDKLEETYRLLYDPKYKNKEVEADQESIDSVLNPEFDEIDGDVRDSKSYYYYQDVHALNLPPENYDE